MASKLIVTEFQAFKKQTGMPMDVPDVDGSAVPLIVDFSGGVASSSAVAAKTSLVILETETACHWITGATPTATTSHRYLDPGNRVIVAITGGHKVSAIAA